VASGGWARAPEEVKAREMIEWKDLGGIAMLTTRHSNLHCLKSPWKHNPGGDGAVLAVHDADPPGARQRGPRVPSLLPGPGAARAPRAQKAQLEAHAGAKGRGRRGGEAVVGRPRPPPRVAAAQPALAAAARGDGLWGALVALAAERVRRPRRQVGRLGQRAAHRQRARTGRQQRRRPPPGGRLSPLRLTALVAFL
jgi:hypothetical protein